jgi:uncharacterized membrane protein YfcA
MPHSYSIALIFLAAGFTQGVSGFGSALVAMPFLLLVIDIKIAVPLCMLNGLVITFYLSIQLRRYVEWRKILPLFIGCVPGIFAGAWFLKETASNQIQVLLGIMIAGYALYNLILRPAPRKIKEGWAYVAGFLTGVIGSAFSAGGPPAIIYTTLTGWNKDDIKATLSSFFFVSGLFIAAAHFATGLTTTIVLKYFGQSVLAVLAGVWAGSLCYDKIRQETYMKIILTLLLAMGVMIIFRSW